MGNDVQLDPRGVRFGAAVSLVFALLAVLIGPSLPGLLVTTALALMFLPGSIWGPQTTLAAAMFRTLIKPRLAPPTETESSLPPRFAQQVGLVMAVLGLLFGLFSITIGFYLMVGFIVVASFLNAVFGLCLGCEIYLLYKRMVTSR